MKAEDFSYNTELQQYSASLFNHADFNYFKHTRVYQNYKTIVLLSNPKQPSYAFQEKCLEMSLNFKIDQSISLVISKNNYKDIFDFAGNFDTDNLKNLDKYYSSFIRKFIENYIIIFESMMALACKAKKENAININNFAINNQKVNKKEMFTKRELECMQYLAAGNTAKTTAKKLNLSPRTVEVYLEKIKEKFGVKRKTEILTKLYNFNINQNA
jgi:DNA-binding CsgD family transcriptional regulator